MNSKHRRLRLRRPPIRGGLNRRNQPGSIWEIAQLEGEGDRL